MRAKLNQSATAESHSSVKLCPLSCRHCAHMHPRTARGLGPSALVFGRPGMGNSCKAKQAGPSPAQASWAYGDGDFPATTLQQVAQVAGSLAEKSTEMLFNCCLRSPRKGSARLCLLRRREGHEAWAVFHNLHSLFTSKPIAANLSERPKPLQALPSPGQIQTSDIRAPKAFAPLDLQGIIRSFYVLSKLLGKARP